MKNEDLINIAHLISVGIITPNDYIPWCDKLILSEESPSELVMDLSIIREPKKASERLLAEAYKNFSEQYTVPVNSGHEEVCSIFLSYKMSSISWEQFLSKAIEITELKGSGWTVNDYQRFLNAYLENGKPKPIELAQSKYTEEAFAEDLASLKSYLEMFEIAAR